MEKTKIIAIAATIAIIAAVAIAGAAFAQNLNTSTQTPFMNGYGQIPTIGNPSVGNNGVLGGFTCPRLYSPNIKTQNVYSTQPRIGMVGMMQRVGW
jgi:hypothetical protein